MTIKTRNDDDGLIDETKLNECERKAFILFLEMERYRHSDSIEKIEETLKKMKQSTQEEEDDEDTDPNQPTTAQGETSPPASHCPWTSHKQSPQQPPTKPQAKATYKCNCGFTVTAHKADVMKIWSKGSRSSGEFIEVTETEYEKRMFRKAKRHRVLVTYEVFLRASRDIYNSRVTCPICGQHTDISKDIAPEYDPDRGPPDGWYVSSKEVYGRVRIKDDDNDDDDHKPTKVAPGWVKEDLGSATISGQPP